MALAPGCPITSATLVDLRRRDGFPHGFPRPRCLCTPCAFPLAPSGVSTKACPSCAPESRHGDKGGNANTRYRWHSRKLSKTNHMACSVQCHDGWSPRMADLVAIVPEVVGSTCPKASGLTRMPLVMAAEHAAHQWATWHIGDSQARSDYGHR